MSHAALDDAHIHHVSFVNIRCIHCLWSFLLHGLNELNTTHTDFHHTFTADNQEGPTDENQFKPAL